MLIARNRQDPVYSRREPSRWGEKGQSFMEA